MTVLCGKQERVFRFGAENIREYQVNIMAADVLAPCTRLSINFV